ncbi:PH domain-containing protein [Candidatus Woesebacteria bacterium]|nr:PH domain-containing protein [Candidatus Woesebacteria bacterium]QQG47630.1 MAG: PH domain-containing protein [Candidatus Woesebacteria bacterium]
MADIFVAEKKKKEALQKDGSHSEFHAQQKKSHNPLSSFCYYPAHANFENKDSEETVVLLMRKHPITNIKWIVVGILMLAAPLVALSFPVLSFLPFRFFMVAILSWYLITSAYIFENFLIWFFNVYIVTDERIFDVDFYNLVFRQISDCELSQIQDVTVRVGSVIRTVLNYGDILIQTAAEEQEFDFEAVPQPDRVAKILRELRVEEEIEEREGVVR